MGILHVLRRGRVRVLQPRTATIDLQSPSLIFYRHPCAHRFEVDDPEGADLVCASIYLGAGLGSPLLLGMPDLLTLPVSAVVGAESTLGLLFDEAFAERSGREAALDRLVEYFMVLLFRHALDAKLVNGGVLAALTDARLVKALTAMHEQPEVAWSLEQLAQKSDMSRSRFAARFREVVGITALDYLTDWRISVAQDLLKQGRPLKVIAPAVGYTNTAAFVRIFNKRVGMSPADWLAA